MIPWAVVWSVNATVDNQEDLAARPPLYLPAPDLVSNSFSKAVTPGRVLYDAWALGKGENELTNYHSVYATTASSISL